MRWRELVAFSLLVCPAATIADSYMPQGKAIVYAAIGAELRDYELDLASATLIEKSAVNLPAAIQAGCPFASGRYLLVAWSDGTNVSAGSTHGLSVFRIDRASETFSENGAAQRLPSRPIFVSTDHSWSHALVAYTSPSGVTIHPIAPDGTTGPALTQMPLKFGVYAHQLLVDPTDTMAILVARGNVPTPTRTEDPGELDMFGYRDGLLEPRGDIAPNAGLGFHPRYLDFHPSGPWVFVSLSQQNEIGVYERQPRGTLGSRLLFEKSSLVDPAHIATGQLSGALHVHPNGKFVYLANRATNATTVDGRSVLSGGENSIAVFAINQATGEPTLIQTVDTRGIGPVEFTLDTSGSVLVVGNMMPMWVSDGRSLKANWPCLVTFRVRQNGTLEFVGKYDVESDKRTLFWMGMSPPPPLHE